MSTRSHAETKATDAERHVAQYQDTPDGQDFSIVWADDADEPREDLPPPEYRDGQGTDTYRFQWPDGSAVVFSAGAWDFGVHADRLAEADAALAGEEETARFAWPESHTVLRSVDTDWTRP